MTMPLDRVTVAENGVQAAISASATRVVRLALFMRSNSSPQVIGRPGVYVAVVQSEKIDVPHDAGLPPGHRPGSHGGRYAMGGREGERDGSS